MYKVNRLIKRHTLSYRFGIFILDVQTAKLYKSGEEVSLTKRCFEILKLLLESHGRVVSKQEILDQIWSDSDVSEANISYHIHVLRRILGESPKNPTIIVTIPGVGYKFMDQVEVVEDGVDRSEITIVDSNPQLPVRNYWYWLIIAVIAMLATIILVYNI